MVKKKSTGLCNEFFKNAGILDECGYGYFYEIKRREVQKRQENCFLLSHPKTGAPCLINNFTQKYFEQIAQGELIKNRRECLTNHNSRLAPEKEKIDKIKKRLEDAEKQLEIAKIHARDRYISDCKKVKINSFLVKIFTCVTIVASVIFLLFLLYEIGVFTSNNPISNGGLHSLAIAFLFTMPILILTSIILAIHFSKSKHKPVATSVDDDFEVKKANEVLVREKSIYSNARTSYLMLRREEESFEKYISKAEWGIAHAEEYSIKIEEVVQKARNDIKEIKRNCKIIYKMLRRQFSMLLDDRDWKHVDLIIFNYETGRAFTRQEALQQVDREVQTERIIANIQEAAKYIGNSVKTAAVMVTGAIATVSQQLRGMSQQLGEMNRSMQGLASGMESVNTRIGALADVQARQLEAANAQNAQIAALVSETSLNNALLAKSNQTSQRLMEDVEYIRYYGTQY